MESHQEHDRIASLVPEADILADDSRTNNIGSYMLKGIVDGVYVPLSNTRAIEANFAEIPALANRDFAAEFVKYTENIATNPETEKLTKALEALPERERKLFTTAMFAVGVAQEFFVNQKVDMEARKNSFVPVDASREDTYAIKKLSETDDSGACVEYSLLAGEVMSKLGEPMNYTVGYRQDWSDEPGIYHAFLTADNGNILVDPLLLAQTSNSPIPMGLLTSEGINTIVSDPTQGQSYNDVSDGRLVYSGLPIAAVEPQW